MSPTTWFRLLGLSCLLILAAFAVPALTQDARKGKKVALLVGVRAYDHNKLGDLRYTENDAEELGKVLKQGGYDEVVVLTTTRGEKDAKRKPTKANIQAELKRLLAGITKRDVILIGLAGHGMQYEVKLDGKRRDESFFCPADARPIDSDDFAKLAETMLPFRAMFKQLDDSGAGSRLLLVDACRNEAGSSRNADTDSMPSPTRGTAALFSCKGGERAHETAKLGKGHGIFFYHVIQAMKGEAKNKRGAVTWSALTRHVQNEVGDDVKELIGGGARQTPHLMANVEGDPVLLTPDKSEEITNGVGMKFKRIPAGKFLMGSTEAEREEVRKAEGHEEHPVWLKAEGPRHEVTITKAFYLGVYEVTQRQWKAVMGKDNNPSFFSRDGGGKDKVKGIKDEDLDDFPVESVSYEDAEKFIEKLNEKEKDSGRRYRLPTEAEWECACRGGASVSKPYHFGDAISDKLANYNGDLGRTSKVGSYRPNGFGLYDMHGNVWEWCSDWYGEDYYTNRPARDPLGPAKGTGRVSRGGSWDNTGTLCRTARRAWVAADFRINDRGFRVVLIPAR